MTPEAALARQIELHRGMTGDQRLEIDLNLQQLACDLAREGIRRQVPGATEAETDEHLRERIRAGRL